jgi:hypothetical protein
MKAFNARKAMRLFIVATVIFGFVGCGSEVRLQSAPVSVSGKVSQSGRPCGGMVMIFQPLGEGHVREVAVQKNGTFNGDLISGEYAYYVAKPAGPGVAQPANKLAAKYFEADLSRTVTVEPGQQLAISLD